MTIKVAIRHSTTYNFDRRVNVTPHVIRLRPAPQTRTPIDSYSLKIEPADHFINWQQDPYGNYLARIVFPEKVKSLSFDVEVIADMVAINPFDFFLEEYAEKYPFDYEADLKHELAPYLVKSESKFIEEWIKQFDYKPMPTNDFLVSVNQQLEKDIGYTIRMEPGVQTCEETLTKRTGSCRDSAWLLVQILRHYGLAARFVSGYLVQLTADEKALDGPSGPEEDFTDLHAWTEVYLPGAGWIGMDPTSGLFASEGHIPLACSPEPSSAAPISGATDKCESELIFENTVRRVYEDPRVTKPYTEHQWQTILRLGESIDQKLNDNDVRLSMGGEPTFVSIDDMEGDEWNTAALGDNKRILADALSESLRREFCPHGLLHTGQGKWYPGEQLPRWALSLFWRKDGQPLWKNPEWLADSRSQYHHNSDDAKSFIEKLADQLTVNQECIRPAYEDVLYNMLQEGRLPNNVDPLDNKLKDPLERERMRKHFEQGIGATVGYALPLAYRSNNGDKSRWMSCEWDFRRNHMFLLPGDSPMGFRLPVDSLPWVEPRKRELFTEPDPFAPKKELKHPLKVELQRVRDQLNYRVNPQFADYQEYMSTALCAEIRNEQLHLFLPPLNNLESFIELISAIEATAKQLNTPVIIEGYTPPKDDRLEMLQVTPDPGVIEVNIHPSSDWNSMVHNTERLYERARNCRLGTEKFMLDGRHTGTGGGNHITMGSQKPIDSPFLRRPDLLGSLIRYWQNHPSLSYLFSGLFIGPTSQAPRVDEARDDNLYELEIALSQLPSGESNMPWQVDRVLRNFLVDLTGNTHRAEFCIDKMYSPDSPSGRKGLLELRAFEMPPHSRMSLVQALLMRSMVSRFWDKPYKEPLIPFGTSLHDRFMLPHYVWSDFSEVIHDMQRAGYDFNKDWFSSFFNFRFPRIGDMTSDDIHLELRTAIEPWHVLGEESNGQTTARYVDSSVERLQVKASGVFGDRYAITCNGRKLPLRPTGVSGEKVAGVRYKAWNPFSSLHPSIYPQAPLTFDVIDTYNEKSIAGCSYYVSHPGGRSYDTFPVNANAAETRRFSRFWSQGHTQQQMRPVEENPHADYPVTLDLRYPILK